MSKTTNKMITTTRLSLVVSLSLVGMTVLSGMILSSSTISAEDIVDEINITVPVSCSLSGTGMTSHTATIENGRYVSDIGTTTLKAFCNDNNGFAVYANGYTGDTLGNNKLIGSSTSSEIVTGTATTAGSPDVSNWAMKLETNSSTTYALTLDNGFGSYSSVPSSYTKVAHRDSGTDLGTSAEGATLTTTYAAYIAKTQPADSYQGQVIYTLVHPSSEEPLQPQPAKPGKIVYHPNTSSVQGQMGDQDATNSAETTLWASNFKRAGYGFAGWNTAYDYSGTNYGPNQTITAPSDVSTNGLSLYAVWIKSAGSLQNWDGCSSLAQGATTALTDERDGNVYAVAKLADNKCWTIENLRLDDSAELSSTNTHNPSLPITNVYNADPAQATTSNHLSATTTNIWCGDINASPDCIDQSMLATNNITLFTNNTSSSYSVSSDVYSYGNYYNWYSATAGNGKYGSSYGYGYVAPGDICPAGWHLPTGGSMTTDLGALDIAMGGTGFNQSGDAGRAQSAKWRSYPNNFIYSGFVQNSITGRGAAADYLTSSGDVEAKYFTLNFDAGSTWFFPGDEYVFRYTGMPVRCIKS